MSNWAEEAYAPVIAAYKEKIMQSTWGHLAPQKNTTYRGKMMVVNSPYSIGIKMINMEWDNLEDSPWIYDYIDKWLWDNRKSIPEGDVHKISCTFRNYKLWIKVEESYSI